MHAASPHKSRTALAGAALLLLLAAAACQPAAATSPAPTLAPTIALPQATEAAPAVEIPGYPAVTEPAALPQEIPAESYPVETEAAGEPVIAGAPVIENRSVVTARLIQQSPDPTHPGYTLLRVEILASQDVAGMQNFTREKVNQEIDLLVETAQLPALEPGENLTGEVSYRGDEWGGNYYGQQVQKAAP